MFFYHLSCSLGKTYSVPYLPDCVPRRSSHHSSVLIVMFIPGWD